MNAHYIPERFSNGVIFQHMISDGDLLADQEFQDPNEVSLVQRFTIGTRLVIGERAFRYGKFHTAVGELSYALVNGNVIAGGVTGDGAEVAYGGAPAIGDRTLVVLDTGSAVNRPVNYYQGGYCFIYRNPAIAQSAINFDQFRRIVSSTVGNTVSITLTLDYPLTCVPAATVDVYPSAYSLIGTPGHFSTGAETFVGFAHAFHAAGGFGWVQTWGPVNAHYVVKFLGERGAPGDRDAYFTSDGGVATAKSASGTDAYVSFQRAGYVIPCTKSAYGSMFFNLQLAP
jgi:hypothetical protein